MNLLGCWVACHGAAQQQPARQCTDEAHWFPRPDAWHDIYNHSHAKVGSPSFLIRGCPLSAALFPSRAALAPFLKTHNEFQPSLSQIEGEFPNILPIKESLIKYVFEPAAANKDAVRAAVREMRGR